MGRFLAFVGGSEGLKRAAAVAVMIAAVAFVLALLAGVVLAVVAGGWPGLIYLLGLVAGLVGILTASTGKEATVARALTTAALLAFALAAMLAPMAFR